MTKLNVFCLTSTCTLPAKAHSSDACFDLSADLESVNGVKCFQNSETDSGWKYVDLKIQVKEDYQGWYIEVPPMSSVIIPTGLCFGIPEGYRVDVRARSGRAAKQMQGLTNGVGTIDSGYKDEIKVLLLNRAAQFAIIRHADRVAQFHLEKVLDTEIQEVDSLYELGETEDRKGGFGSTGN